MYAFYCIHLFLFAIKNRVTLKSVTKSQKNINTTFIIMSYNDNECSGGK